MIDNKVTEDQAKGLEPARPRILARQLARPLTDDEIAHVAGGLIARGGFALAPRADTCTCTGCPVNDSDA